MIGIRFLGSRIRSGSSREAVLVWGFTLLINEKRQVAGRGGERDIMQEKDVMGLLKTRRLFFDGGTGSLLQEAGLKPGELPETFNISHPEIITGLHVRYLEAGCDIIKTNTFGANRLKYNETAEYTLEAVVKAALSNARQAVRQTGKGFIALDLGPTGKLLKPMGQLDFEVAVNIYKEVVELGTKAGADLILLETMSDSYELKAAVLAAKENSTLPVFATVIYDENGRLLTGGDPRSVIALLEGLGVDAIGINCGLGPEEMKKIAAEYVNYASVPVIVNPNAGLPKIKNGKTIYDISPDSFAAVMEEIADLGVSILGGCCGTTPDHMRELTLRCRNKAPIQIEAKNRTVASSFAKSVEFGGEPILIGERINPTGKPELKEALLTGDLECLLREAVLQQEAGVHALDINMGLPGIDEAFLLAEAVQQLQSITELPLQLDTSDVTAMERAMRLYNGKALINSVNGKAEVMETVFPLIKHYGGVVIALTLDENGIPEDAGGRVEIAKRIYKTAEEHGIHKHDILIDCLCMAVGSEARGALTTLEAVERIRTELGGRTILGVSNVSFGLPERENLNAAFFSMALTRGLDGAIINPCSEMMLRTYNSFRVLSALDANCSRYIAAYGDNGSISGHLTGHGTQQMQKMDLEHCVIKGFREQAKRLTEELLLTERPMEIIDKRMIPALDEVGKAYEQGRLFLPQLLMSAEAAKTAFEVIKQTMDRTGAHREKKGRILLATVEGDIHDIGKNIVKVLLENYGYEVIDLGKDVKPRDIAGAAVTEGVQIVGLSALMTTTVPRMEQTIKLLREVAPNVRIMVGGAVLTPEYAEYIGADRYCSDAMGSVKYAQELLDII